MSSYGTREQEAADAAGREAKARLNEWYAARHRCGCAEPLPERYYLGHWSCRLCCQLIVTPAERHSHVPGATPTTGRTDL